jgi:hypothetical protein
MISTRSVGLLIDTVVCLTLAKWETVSGRFGGYLSSLAKETVVAIPTRYGDTKFEEKLSFDDQPLRAATRRSVARMGRSFLVLFF